LQKQPKHVRDDQDAENSLSPNRYLCRLGDPSLVNLFTTFQQNFNESSSTQRAPESRMVRRHGGIVSPIIADLGGRYLDGVLL